MQSTGKDSKEILIQDNTNFKDLKIPLKLINEYYKGFTNIATKYIQNEITKVWPEIYRVLEYNRKKKIGKSKIGRRAWKIGLYKPEKLNI